MQISGLARATYRTGTGVLELTFKSTSEAVAFFAAIDLGNKIPATSEPRAPRPTWAEQNLALRKSRDEMDRAKKIEQQQEQQRQFHQQAVGDLIGHNGGPPIETWSEPARDPRPKRCVAGL